MNVFDWLAAMRQAEELTAKSPKYNPKNGSIHAFVQSDGSVELRITAPKNSNCNYIRTRYEDLIPLARWVIATFGEPNDGAAQPTTTRPAGEERKCRKCGRLGTEFKWCCSTALGGS